MGSRRDFFILWFLTQAMYLQHLEPDSTDSRLHFSCEQAMIKPADTGGAAMHEIDKARFGRFVAELRREKNYTQKQLA